MDNLALFTSMEMIKFDRKHKEKEGEGITDLLMKQLQSQCFRFFHKTANCKFCIKVWWGKKMPVSLKKKRGGGREPQNCCAVFRYYIEFKDRFLTYHEQQAHTRRLKIVWRLFFPPKSQSFKYRNIFWMIMKWMKQEEKLFRRHFVGTYGNNVSIAHNMHTSC